MSTALYGAEPGGLAAREPNHPVGLSAREPHQGSELPPSPHAPGVLIDEQEPGRRELAVQQAVRALAAQYQGMAILVLPFDPGAPPALALPGLRIDERAREVRLDGRVVHLTYKEFSLLSYLQKRRDMVVTREELLRELWGQEYEGGMRTVDIHVRRLRKKLGDDCLDTVRGFGYRFGVGIRVLAR